MSTEADNALGMSDEDFLKMNPSEYPVGEAPADEEAEDEELDTTPPTPEEDDDLEDDSAEDASTDEDEEEDSDAEGEEESSEESEEGEDPQASSEGEEEDSDSEDTDTSDEEAEGDDTPDVDYKTEFEKLTAPFRASGRNIQVKNAEEAIHLMQMGADYGKKMSALKPNLKLLKTLEKHDLLDESKLGFLIDLSQNKPEAITKLLKDSKVDPMDLDLESESDYKPNTYTATDAEVDLDMVLEEIKDSDTYDRTLDVVANKWDGASREIVSQSPQTLKVLNDHIASGIYDKIADEVARQRALGRLMGMSDIQAYREIGDAMAAQGAFGTPEATPPKQPAARTAPRKPVKNDKALKDKKRAASPARKAAPATPTEVPNVLAMSDEDFEKLEFPGLY